MGNIFLKKRQIQQNRMAKTIHVAAYTADNNRLIIFPEDDSIGCICLTEKSKAPCTVTYNRNGNVQEIEYLHYSFLGNSETLKSIYERIIAI